MTGGPSGKKRGPGDLRHPAGAQHARLKRENTAKLPKGVTGVILGGKPGTHTIRGDKKKIVQITQKQMDALHTAKRSEKAGHKMVRDKPPKTSVRTYIKSKLGKRTQGKRRPATRGGSRR